MKNSKKKIVVTTFYSKGKAVWIAERPDIMTDSEIAKKNEQAKEYGYGEVDAITDTTGRMITFVNGDFLREVEE